MAQAASVDKPPRLPMVAVPSNRDETTSKDSRLVNAYVEKSETGELSVYKRPGLTSNLSKTGNGYGVFNWRGNVYAVFGTTLYKNGTSLGTVDGTGFTYKFSSHLGGTPRLFMMNGVKAYTVKTDDTLTQVTDVNYPAATVKGAGNLDATLYVMDSSAKTYGSSINDGTSWPALNTLVAQIEPDGGVALAKQLVYILALKQWTTEVFYDAANAVGSPLSPVQGARIDYGCASADSVQQIDDSLIWMSVNRSAGFQVVMVVKLKAEIISTKPVERLIAKATTTSGNIFSWSFRRDGHTFYGLTLKAQNITLVYDLTEGAWAQWTDTNGNYFPIVDATFNGTTYYLQHETNGNLYDVDASYVNDAGSPITVDIYTPLFDGDTKRRKYLAMLEFVADQVAGCILQVRKSDNDYQTWSNFRNVDLSTEKPYLQNCGTFKRRAYHFRHTVDTKLHIKAVELQLDIGTL